MTTPTLRQTGWAAHRDYYAVPVLFNPYTGEPRDVRDVKSDPQGTLIVPQGKVEMLAAQPEQEPKKLWLWKNFVDGKPEYWVFDNAFPIHLDCDDPQTLGEPCGYAIFKPSREGRTDISDREVLLRIKKAATQPQPEPTCPKCKAAVLYECVACSSNNYPPKAQQERWQWIFEDKCGDRYTHKNLFYTETEAAESAKICGVKAIRKTGESKVTAATPAAQPEQGPIGWLDGNETLAEFMHRDLKAAHDRRGSATPREFTIPVYLAPPAAQPEHGDIRALKYRIHELEGEVIGYKRMLEEAELKKLADLGQQIEQEPWRESASDYERGVIDGMQKQAQSSVDKAVNAMAQRKPLTCEWSPADDDAMPGTYSSACGELWSFIDGGWQENRVRFCHGCGGKVEAAHGIKEGTSLTPSQYPEPQQKAETNGSAT